MAELTFEAINARVERADLKAFQPGGTHHVTAAMALASPADVLKKLCAIYSIVKPILQGLIAMPFIPSKWKDVVKAFIGILDELCPGS
jgi:hypothetical protein